MRCTTSKSETHIVDKNSVIRRGIFWGCGRCFAFFWYCGCGKLVRDGVGHRNGIEIRRRVTWWTNHFRYKMSRRIRLLVRSVPRSDIRTSRRRDWTTACLREKLQWRHNGRDSVSNHQPHDCLLSRLFRHRSKKTSKLRVTGLYAGNSPVTSEFPAQMASNAENVSIWWRHHETG